MANISSIAQLTSASGALTGLILVNPQVNTGIQAQSTTANNIPPQSLPPGFLFHYEGEQTTALESDITDHFIENNSAINDQIALRPELITTHGYIGELNDVAPKILQTLKTASQKLTVISAYTPALSQSAILAYNEAQFAYTSATNLLNALVNVWSSTPNQTKQQIAFGQFYGWWQSRTLFTVQTPWAIFPDMAIKTLRAVQDADTRVITDFEITFKKMRFASVANNLVNAEFQGRGAAQASNVVDLGETTPPTAPLTLEDVFNSITSKIIGA